MIERPDLTDDYDFSDLPYQKPRNKNHSADLVPIPSDGVKCNARLKRTRGYCNNASMANGRCQYHGGMTRGLALDRPQTDIKKFRHQYLAGDQQERFKALADGDLLESLEESIRIQQVLEAAALERFATGESPEAWKRMSKGLDSIAALDPFDFPGESDAEAASLYAAAVRREVADLKEAAAKAARDWDIIGQVQELHEGQRKITESLYKSRNLQQKTYTQEQVQTLLNAIVITIREQGTPDMVHAIAGKIALLTGERSADVKSGGTVHGVARAFAPKESEMAPIEIEALAVEEKK